MIKRFAAFAFAAFAAFGARAELGLGDIRSIEAVDDYSRGIFYPNDRETPPHYTPQLKVGESFYILVRLLNQDPRDSVPHEWKIERSSDGAIYSDAMAVFYKPGLRIAIGNEIVTAYCVDNGPNEGERTGINTNNFGFTDFYFKYTVKEGQLGLPVRLVNVKGEIVDAAVGDTSGFQFVNVKTVNDGQTLPYWELTNDQGGMAEFWFGPEPDNCPNGYPYPYPDHPSVAEHRIMELVHPGVYVQTIDFESTTVTNIDGNIKIWRRVYPGLSINYHDNEGKVDPDPAIRGTASSDVGSATTVYIWSEDESVFSVDGIPGETVSYRVKGKQVNRTVYPVQLTANGVSAFKLKGGATAAPGAWTNIVLCATKIPAINASGDIVKGCVVTQPVLVVPSPPPYITITDESGKAKSQNLWRRTTIQAAR